MIDAAATGRPRRRGQHLDPLVVTDGLNVYAAALGQRADREHFGSRSCDRRHEIVLDPVVATGCSLIGMTVKEENFAFDSGRGHTLMAVGGLFGALAASSCCILPVVLFSLGI